MARDRLALALALAACRGAQAAPNAPGADDLRAALGVPAAWSELPQVAAAARKAGSTLRASAWGDPAAGCYLIVASARVAKDDADAAKAALAAGLGVPAGAPLDGKFARGDLRGASRGWVTADGDDVIATAAACVYNDREPTACASACDAVWAKLTSAPVIP